jgi:hypothetical protein
MGGPWRGEGGILEFLAGAAQQQSSGSSRFCYTVNVLKHATTITKNRNYEKSHDYSRKPQRNCTFMKSISLAKLAAATPMDSTGTYRREKVPFQQLIGEKLAFQKGGFSSHTFPTMFKE